MTLDNFTSSRKKGAATRSSRAYDTMGALRPQYHLYTVYIFWAGVDALQIDPSRPPRGLARDVLFFEWATWTWTAGGGVCKPSKARGASKRWSGWPFLWSQIHVPANLPFRPRPQTGSLGSPATRCQTTAFPRGRDLTPEDDVPPVPRLSRDRSSSRRRAQISGRSQEKRHKIQIPKHASEAFPPDGRQVGQ
jgi:hypothetical protein